MGVPGLLDAAIAKLPALLGGYLPEFDPHALIAPPALGAEAGPLGAIALALAAAGPAADPG